MAVREPAETPQSKKFIGIGSIDMVYFSNSLFFLNVEIANFKYYYHNNPNLNEWFKPAEIGEVLEGERANLV